MLSGVVQRVLPGNRLLFEAGQCLCLHGPQRSPRWPQYCLSIREQAQLKDKVKEVDTDTLLDLNLTWIFHQHLIKLEGAGSHCLGSNNVQRCPVPNSMKYL